MESILCPAKDKDLEKSILNINITIKYKATPQVNYQGIVDGRALFPLPNSQSLVVVW